MPGCPGLLPRAFLATELAGLPPPGDDSVLRSVIDGPNLRLAASACPAPGVRPAAAAAFGLEGLRELLL